MNALRSGPGGERGSVPPLVAVLVLLIAVLVLAASGALSSRVGTETLAGMFCGAGATAGGVLDTAAGNATGDGAPREGCEPPGGGTSAGAPDSAQLGAAGPPSGSGPREQQVAIVPPSGGGAATGKQLAPNAYPFMTSVQLDYGSKGEHFCGGTVIRDQWVVTAAHCLEKVRWEDVRLRIGTNDRHVGGQVVRLAPDGIVPHPRYDDNAPAIAAQNDIALLRLADPVPGALPVAVSTPPAGTPVRMLGWGHTCPEGVDAGKGCVIDGENRYPYFLRQLDTSVRDDADSACNIARFHPQTELCVDNPSGQGACLGDSGGPLVVGSDGRWSLVGATSRIPRVGGCGSTPSIYTDLSHHNRWIESVAGPQR